MPLKLESEQECLRLSLTVLRYDGGKRRNATVNRAFTRWRALQDPPIPDRCDNKACCFYTRPLIWNGAKLKPILAHCNGVNSDNRTENLRFLCPNCDSQDLSTRGGASINRVVKSSGGFAITERGSPTAYTLPAEAAIYSIGIQDAGLLRQKKKDSRQRGSD